MRGNRRWNRVGIGSTYTMKSVRTVVIAWPRSGGPSLIQSRSVAKRSQYLLDGMHCVHSTIRNMKMQETTMDIPTQTARLKRLFGAAIRR